MSLSADLRRSRTTRVLRGTATAALPAADPVTDNPSAALHLIADECDLPDDTPERIEEARAEGYAAGYAEALASAIALAEHERAAAVSRAANALEDAAAAVGKTRAQLVAEATEDALDLTYELLATILDDDAVARSVPPAALLRRTLALAPQEADLIVRVHPHSPLRAEDLPTSSLRSIRLHFDESIDEDGCVIEAGACRIDAQRASALARVRALLSEKRPTGPVEP